VEKPSEKKEESDNKEEKEENFEYTLHLGQYGSVHSVHRQKIEQAEFLKLFLKIEYKAGYDGFYYKDRPIESEETIWHLWAEKILKINGYRDIKWKVNRSKYWSKKPEQKIKSKLVYKTESGQEYHKVDCEHLGFSKIEIKTLAALRKYKPCLKCFPEKDIEEDRAKGRKMGYCCCGTYITMLVSVIIWLTWTITSLTGS
jgi:hypothetical protein